MVRTSGGIRISAGKSSKKGGGGGASHSSAPSTPSGSKGSSRLPPIPYCEAPSWQKPITNFFNAEASSSKDSTEIIKNGAGTHKDNGESTSNKISDTSDIIEETDPDDIIKDKADIENETEDPIKINDDEPQIKKRKEQDKENEDININN